MKAIRRASQKFYWCSVEGCNSSENVTRASMCCKYSSGVYLWSKPSNGFIGSNIKAEEIM